MEREFDERREIYTTLMKFKKWDLALEVLEDLRQDYPKEEEILVNISKIYENKGLYNEAISYLELLLDTNRDNGKIYFKIATLYQKSGELNKCYEFLNIAISYGYDSEKVFFYMGLIYEDKLNFEKAIEYYKKSLSKNKSYKPSNYRIYRIYLKFNKYEEAKKCAEQMIINNSCEYDGYNLLFSLLLNLKELEKAKEILEKAKEVFGDYEILNLDFIKYYIYIKDYNKAEHLINRVSNDNEFFSEFQIEYSKIKSMEGKSKEAIEILKNDYVYNEENIYLLFLIGVNYLIMNNYEEAIKQFDIIKQSNKDDEFVKISMYLSAYTGNFIYDKKTNSESFEHLYKVYKSISISNPYDVNVMIFKIFTLIELEKYNEAVSIIKSIENIEEFNKSINIDIIMNIIEERKKGIIDSKKVIYVINKLYS